VLAAALALAAVAADAKTLRWAGRGDIQTTDPHSQNENLTNNINQLVYEFLVVRDKKLGLRPGLAESWTKVNATTWRFKLRPGVKFHDGTPFTADDVVFSFERARSDTSQLRGYAKLSGIPRKIDDLTVEFTTDGANPVELEHINTINIMSKAWCEKNRATKPQNFTQKEDMITAHQANGTGAYMLKSREPDIKTVLVKNPNWWGIKAGLWEGNADEVIYLPIVSDATRVAALMSGGRMMRSGLRVGASAMARLARRRGSKSTLTSRIVAVAYDASGALLTEVHLSGGDPYEFSAGGLSWGALQASCGMSNSGALGPVCAFGLSKLEAGCAVAGIARVTG